MEDKQALRPNFINGGFASLEKEEEEQSDSELEEEALGNLSLTGGWKIIDDYIQELEDELDGMVRGLMAAGASFEEIGQRATVKEVAKDALEKVRARIRDAKDATVGE